MSQEQNKTISGIIYDVYNTASQEVKENRAPRVGQTVEFEDGRKLIFCSSAVDITKGQTVGAPAEIAIAASGILPIGARKVNIIEAAIVANAWKNGHLVIGGVSYKVKSNKASATVAAVANTVIVELYDPLVAAVPDTTVGSVLPYRPQGVVVGTASLDIVGTALVGSLAATQSKTNYFWVQYSGPGAIATAVVKPLGVMATAAGAAIASDGTLRQIAYVTGAPVGGVAPAVISCDGC